MTTNNPSPTDEPKLVTTLGTDRQMSTVRFSACGTLLAAAGRDATIRLWRVPELAMPVSGEDAATGHVEASPGPQAKGVPAQFASPKKSLKGKASEPVFQELPRLTDHEGWVTNLAFHPHQRRLFSVDSWGRLCAWSFENERCQLAWQVKDAHDGWIRQVAVSPGGDVVATCGKDQQIRLWAPADGRRIRQFADSIDDVYSLAFHPDGKSLVSGHLKGNICHWDLATGQATREFDARILYLYSNIQDVGGVRALVFNRAGSVLAAAGTRPQGGGFVQGTPIVRLFDWQTGNQTSTLELGDTTEVFVHELALHPRGFFVGVVSGQPGKGKLFFLRPGDAQPCYVNAKGLPNCHSVALHRDGQRLAVIANAGTFGQRKSKAREGIYPGNTSPILIFQLPAT